MDLKSYLNSKNPIIDYSPTSNGATTFGSVGSGTGKWWGGVLAHNGKIYCIPHASSTVLVIDPEKRTTYTFTCPTTPSYNGINQRWAGGVLAPNGKIYGIPWNLASSVNLLEIDPIVDSAKIITGIPTGNVSLGDNLWIGGVLASTGKIYSMPALQAFGGTLEIDLTTDPITFNIISSPSITPGNWRGMGGVLGPDGKIYVIIHENPPLVIDPIARTNTAPITSTGITYNLGILHWSGGALAINGKIYGIPWNNTAILCIDTVAKTATVPFGALAGTQKWSGGVLSPNGNIYGIPYDSTSVLKIDPINSTATVFGSFAGSGKWRGGVLAENGKIYGIPFNSPSVLEISDISIVQRPAKWLLSAYVNKF